MRNEDDRNITKSLQVQTDRYLDAPLHIGQCCRWTSTPRPSQIELLTLSLLATATRLDVGETSMLRTPCRTSAQFTVSMSSALGAGAPSVTHASDLFQVTVNVCPHHLDCDLLPLIFALPHIPEPTTVQRDPRWIIVKVHLQGSGKQDVVGACLA